MSVKPIVELTADGSHTLFVPELNEHYHSVNGAIQESTHIFINAGLHHCGKDAVDILEIGFGTGLNAFLTLLGIKGTRKMVHYTGIELYPLSGPIIHALNYPERYAEPERELYYKLHDSDWEQENEILPNFHLTKIEADFTQFDFSTAGDSFDLIYFDAFAPDKQGEMWSQEIFDKLYTITNPQGILTTYCAKGSVRRMMRQAGYLVERLPGPPGKREMLRGRRPSNLPLPCNL